MTGPGRRVDILVLAAAGDPGLEELARLPPGVRAWVGQTPEHFAEAAPAAEVLLYCSGGRALLEAVWSMAGGLRWVHTRPAGVDRLLFPALAESPVPLTNSRGLFSRSLAEFVALSLLFFAKDVPRMRRSQSGGVWDQFEPDMVRGRTLGIVGFGDIGRAVAEHGRALGMRVLALRRRPQAGRDPFADAVFGPGDLPALLAQADDVALTAPLTSETRGMIGPSEIGLLKPTSVLVNVGRGPLVDESALVAALRTRRIRGAALDVFEQEPLPAGHPFFALDNVLLSPHCADQTTGWQRGAMDLFRANLERYLVGEPLLNPVDKALGY